MSRSRVNPGQAAIQVMASLFHILMLGILIKGVIAATMVVGHCDLLIDERQECGFVGIGAMECRERGCCWIPHSEADPRNPPWCTIPGNRSCGYTGDTTLLTQVLHDVCNVTNRARFQASFPYDDIAHLSVSRETDFQMPSWLYSPLPSGLNVSKSLDITLSLDPNQLLHFKVTRKTNGSNALWDTDTKNASHLSSFRLVDKYTQIGSVLPRGHHLFGLGYRAGGLRVRPGSRVALFARDSPTVTGQNLYGAHPFYLQMQDGQAHGVVR